MKAVSNTSPVIWLNKIGKLDVLVQVYDGIYTTPDVKREIATFPRAPLNFVNEHLTVPSSIDADKKRFNRLVRRWMRKLELEDKADIEVLIAYKFYAGDADEMVFANNEAERKLGPYGLVRDIADLYVPAEKNGIFSREETLSYLHALKKREYRTPYITQLIKALSR